MIELKSRILSDEDLVLPAVDYDRVPQDNFSTENPAMWAQNIIEPLTSVPFNWDGYGAAQPKVDSLKSACALLKALRSAYSIDQPYTSPTRNGGVLFIWQRGSVELEVQLEGLLHVSYVYSTGNAHEEITDEFDLAFGIDLRFKHTLRLFFDCSKIAA
jgi:hypothetical protein